MSLTNCLLRMSQVFLDELNASTCGGLFKELIIDKSFEGEVTDNDEMLTSLVDFFNPNSHVCVIYIYQIL